MQYDAIIFDNDGVLVELTDRTTLRQAAEDAYASLGVAAPDPAHVDEIVLGARPETVEAVCAPYGLDPAEFWRTRDLLTAAVQRAEIRAGRTTLYDDFDAVRTIDVPLGIVSSNQQLTVDFMHHYFGTRSLFSPIYGREPTVESLSLKKPHPHYVERALDALDIDNALFVGDSETDVGAAHAAGLDSAFIRRPHRVEYDLSESPTYEVSTLSALVALDGVPVGDRPAAD